MIEARKLSGEKKREIKKQYLLEQNEAEKTRSNLVALKHEEEDQKY